MSAATVRPAEEWAPLFTKHWRDDQLVSASYAVSRGSRGAAYCKLCDAHFTGTVEAHLAAHTTDLARWRKAQRKVAEARSVEALATARQERALARGTTPANASKLPPVKQAANRVSSLRYRLNHPEKHGRTEWTKPEEAEIHESLKAAVAALEDLRKGT